MTTDRHDLIASTLSWGFNRYYAKFGYNYHIGVSDAAKGFTNSVTFCKTECHYFYNYHEKNVYILRNKISQNGYQKCEYLEAFKDNEKASDWCDNNFGKNENVYGDLRDFANDITLHCNIYAISVVKTSLKYKDDFEEKMAFGTGVYEFPCFGQINVAISNYPL
uniref:Uncharacterized protein n=1 Tax=Panagrolaimus superbus TaxID=310955 RepID=A0A914YXW5_9BILA